MKAKNILMTLLLVTGAIAAKASGYPPELALVSQPVMVYNYNSVTVYYDVENIGDYTYRGYVSLYLNPDYGYSYAEKYVRVYPGRIKRIAINIPLHRLDRRYAFTIMPYYELDDELYSFTTFEYFEPISFFWDGPRAERWVVVTVPPRIRHYHRPGIYRYYYDGYRPPMPPHGHGYGTPPPMDPRHHTYNYHRNNGGYPNANNNGVAPGATVRPKPNGGSMSSGNSGGSTNPAAPSTNSGSSSSRVNSSNGNGRTPNSGTNNSSSSRVNSSNSNSRVPNSGTNNSSNGRVNSSNGNNSRPNSGTSSSSSSRVNNSSSNNRSSSGTSSSSSSSNNRSNSNSRSSGTSNNSSRSSSSGRR